MTVTSPGEMAIKTEGDIVLVRRTAREVAMQTGFGATDVTRIVTASSEMARNIFKYAGEGCMRWRTSERDGLPGIELEFEDHGPGIADLNLALQEGYTTGEGLGMGLPGAKRLMDELEIRSQVGKGTKVVLRKWKRTLQ
ncbi:MAG TPA: anti-sigma regulatory factor [Verrucomicrobiae bacterium]|nr:anti-sigma regulatory factor [Verrucomicrobiae bacterium]